MQDRQHIMDVAIALFKERGYDQVTISEICKEANIAYSTFFYQFKNKGNLLWEYGVNLFSIAEAMENALTESSPLDKLLCLRLTYIRAYEALGKPLVSQMIFLRSQNPDYWREYSASIDANNKIHAALLKSAQECGEVLNTDPPENICRVCSSLVTGKYLAWAANPDNHDLVSDVMHSIEILLQVAPHKRRYS